MIFDAEKNTCWRRNRNNSTMEDDEVWKQHSVGVDINRNFDIAWDFERILDMSARGAKRLNSDSARNELYRGDHPMSEPETQNLAWVFAKFQRISWLMDVRVLGRRVVTPWGIDLNQDNVTEQNWRNKEFGR
jgi:zinc carboxypeptidase